MTEWQQKALGVSLIVLLTLFNIRGVKLGAIIQDIFTVAKIVPIAVIIVFGLFMGQQTPDLSVIPASNPSIPSLIGMVAFAVVSSLWAYTGWTNINVISEEIKNPKRISPWPSSSPLWQSCPSMWCLTSPSSARSPWM